MHSTAGTVNGGVWKQWILWTLTLLVPPVPYYTSSTSVLFPPCVFLCPRSPSSVRVYWPVWFGFVFLLFSGLPQSVFVSFCCLPLIFFFFLGLQLTFIIKAAFCSFIHPSWCLAFGSAQKVYFYFLVLVYFEVNTIDILQFTRCSKMFFFFFFY